MTSFADYARHYSQLGWALTRLEGKVPKAAGWQQTRPGEPEFVAGQWAEWGQRYGMGVVLGTSGGPRGLAVFEYDDETRHDQFFDLVGDSAPPLCRTGSGKHHAYFVAIEGVAKAAKDGLELRIGAHQCVVPPSLHPGTGAPYEWVSDPWTTPPPPLPQPVIDYFRPAHDSTGIPPVIAPGERHDTMVRLAASMVAKGIDEPAVLAALRGLNAEQTAGHPKPDPELVAIARDAMGWRVRSTAPTPRLPDGPVFIDLRDIAMRDVTWIDKPFLPEGELVTINADGDTGKGLVSVHWAARISRGEFGDPRMVVFVVAEDAFETVLKPRLVAAGANLEHIRVLGWRRAGTEDALRIPDDIPVLEQHTAAMDTRMIVIDPLLSHLSGKTNSHTDHEVKLALKPLMTLAHNTGCVVLGNGHFGKDKTGGARKASMGSTAFTNTPRVGMAMAYDDEDPDLRVLEVIKSNISPKGVGRNYRIRTVEVDGLTEPVPILVAEGAATKAVDDLIAATTRGKRIPSELVRELILAELQTGEKSRKHLDAIALEKLGANPDTLYRGMEPLRKDGRVKLRKDGKDGAWYYRLSLEEQL